MQLQITTDYAIRIIGYLSEQSENGVGYTRAKEMAEELGISQQYIMKIIKKLKDAETIESGQGRQGGYKITEKGLELTFYDIICIMENDLCINRCLENDKYCSRDATDSCSVHNLLSGLQDELVKMLDSKKVKDVWLEEDED